MINSVVKKENLFFPTLDFGRGKEKEEKSNKMVFHT